jgi:predicted ferric reductase
LVVIAAAVLLPLVWFVPLVASRDPIALLSQYFGSVALILMGLSQLMATRWRGVETVFGGLDRVYVLHKWIGVGALAMVLLHDTIDAEMKGLAAVPILEEVAETFGELSLYGLLILIVLSIATAIPYHLWRWTHRFMGGFFALSAFHFIFIAKPFSMGDPLGLYVGAFCLVGVAAYLYTLLPMRRLAASRGYAVDSVERTGGALAITLSPLGGAMRHRAGQFAFVGFDQPDLTEMHPFTLSNAPNEDGVLRFSIKLSGDYTQVLAHLMRAGLEARVEGPYGHFARRKGASAEVWVAAGIGITPFLAWAQAMEAGSPPVHLFFCVRNRAEAAHLTELEALAEAQPALTLHLVVSSVGGRLKASAIQSAIGDKLPSAHAYFCGPTAMRETLLGQLAALGLPRGRFHFEKFEIRSGIGLRKVAGWLIEQFLRRTAKDQPKDQRT